MSAVNIQTVLSHLTRRRGTVMRQIWRICRDLLQNPICPRNICVVMSILVFCTCAGDRRSRRRTDESGGERTLFERKTITEAPWIKSLQINIFSAQKKGHFKLFAVSHCWKRMHTICVSCSLGLGRIHFEKMKVRQDVFDRGMPDVENGVTLL